MNIVIVGLGKFGMLLTENLAKEDHDIVVIDKNPSFVEHAVNTYDVKGFAGNGAAFATLKSAEVKNYDLLIATTSSDEVNILSCLVGSKMGIKHTIARVRNPEYSSEKDPMLKQIDLGISLALNPDLETAREILRIILFPSATKIEPFANGRVSLTEVHIDANDGIVGKALSVLREKNDLSFLVCAVRRQGEVIVPKGDFILEANDTIYLACSTKDLAKVFKKYKMFKDKLKSTMIIGGGRVGYYLAQGLSANKVAVKIIEENPLICQSLSDQLTDVLVLNGNGTNQMMLLEEGLESEDAVVTLTGYDETNIIISTFAKSKNVKKVVTKVNNSNYDLILNNLGLDSVISAKEVFANYIIRYVRSLDHANTNTITNLYRFANNKVEALEFKISSKASFTGKQIKNLKFKDNILLACIIRDKEVIIPCGNDTIEVDDGVIIINATSTINDVADIFMEQ